MNRLKTDAARKSAVAACGTAIAIAAAAAGTAVAAGSAPKGIPDVKSLFNPALAYVRGADSGQLAKAVVYEADAVVPKPAATTAGITSWKFVFQNPTPNSQYASATVLYGPSPKKFNTLIASPEPFLEDVVIAKAPTLSLLQGLAKLRAAGYRGKFSSVVLRDPLGPKQVDPMYIFGVVGKGFVAVDALNGKVSKY